MPPVAHLRDSFEEGFNDKKCRTHSGCQMGTTNIFTPCWFQGQGRISSPHDGVRLHGPRPPGQGIDTWRRRLKCSKLESFQGGTGSQSAQTSPPQGSSKILSSTRILPWAALRVGCNPNANIKGSPCSPCAISCDHLVLSHKGRISCVRFQETFQHSASGDEIIRRWTKQWPDHPDRSVSSLSRQDVLEGSSSLN